MYICVFSRSVGAGSATTRKMRGLTRSVIALIVPPLPAPSRPSNTMHTFSPLCLTHSCILTSSMCSFFSALSYSLLDSSFTCASGACTSDAAASSDAAAASGGASSALLSFLPFLLMIRSFVASEAAASARGHGKRRRVVERPAEREVEVHALRKLLAQHP